MAHKDYIEWLTASTWQLDHSIGPHCGNRTKEPGVNVMDDLVVCWRPAECRRRCPHWGLPSLLGVPYFERCVLTLMQVHPGVPYLPISCWSQVLTPVQIPRGIPYLPQVLGGPDLCLSKTIPLVIFKPGVMCMACVGHDSHRNLQPRHYVCVCA